MPVTVFNLNSVGSTATLEAALAALQRCDPTRRACQVEQLASIGNSFYHGLDRRGAAQRSDSRSGAAGGSLRAAYTLSRLIDDGVVNTSSALRVGDFRAERSRSLLDRRHRFVLSGTLDAPRALGRLRFASDAPSCLRRALQPQPRRHRPQPRRRGQRPPRLRQATRACIRWRRPRRAARPAPARSASGSPLIGHTGDLPRNAGLGPALFTLDLSVAREFRLGERARLRPTVEIDNLLNKTVYTFGAEFINFNALRPDATAEQRRAFADTFLVPTRTLRPRTVRVGVRLDF